MKIARLIIIALLLIPTTAWAQSPDQPQHVVTLSDLPDTYGYRIFTIPQCGNCGPDSLNLTKDTTAFPQHDFWYWIDPRNYTAIIGELIQWLLAGIKNLFLSLFCFLFMIFQYLANFLTTILNTIIFLLNFTIKLVVFIILTIQTWFLTFWDLYETIRMGINEVLRVLSLVWQWLISIATLLIEVVKIAFQSLMIIAESFLHLIGILSYVMGIIIGVFVSIGSALKLTTTPGEINTYNGHMFYSFLRGSLDGLLDSSINWLVYLNLGLANLATLIRVVKKWTVQQ